MRHRADALALIERQMQTVEERISAAIERTRRKTTLSDLEMVFRDSPRRPDCSPGMLEFYCGVVRRFAASFGPDAPVSSVGASAAGGYARELARRTAAGTYNKAINALSLVWRTCAREAGLEAEGDPWAEIARRSDDLTPRRTASGTRLSRGQWRRASRRTSSSRSSATRARR